MCTIEHFLAKTFLIDGIQELQSNVVEIPLRARRVSSAPCGIYLQCSSDVLLLSIWRGRQNLPSACWRFAGFMYGSLDGEDSFHPRGFPLSPPGQAKALGVFINKNPMSKA